MIESIGILNLAFWERQTAPRMGLREPFSPNIPGRKIKTVLDA
jgi:hypothetical protein